MRARADHALKPELYQGIIVRKPAKVYIFNIGLGELFEMQQPRRKRSPSPHQKQMRFFTVLFTTTAIGAFALTFYCVNRWLMK